MINKNDIFAARITQSLTALLGARKPEDPLPARLQIFKWGENDSNQGKFIVNDTTVKLLAANQRLLGRERIPMGFEHNIDEGSEEYKRTTEPRPIAAKCGIEIIPEQGIFLTAIDWTKEGRASIEHYEDLSPTPVIDKRTRSVIGLMSVSLTRAGSLNNLTFDNAAQARLSATLNPNPQTEDPMNPTISIAKLAAALSLPADATEDQVIARLAAPQTVRIKIGDAEQELTVAQLGSRLITLETQLSADRTQSATAERGTLIARLAADGKAPLDPDTAKPYSAEQLAAMTPATLRMLAANTAATVPLTQRNRLSAGGAEAPVLDANLKGINRVIAANDRDNAMSKRN